MLLEDSATELVIVVSKPPAKEVADEITAYAEGLATPVQLAFLGAGQPDLTAAARRAVETIGVGRPRRQTWAPTNAPSAAAGSLRGLFAGGTLCDEAMVIAAQPRAVRSNIPLQPDWALRPDDLPAPRATP